jgi:hypothetical protein
MDKQPLIMLVSNPLIVERNLCSAMTDRAELRCYFVTQREGESHPVNMSSGRENPQYGFSPLSVEITCYLSGDWNDPISMRLHCREVYYPTLRDLEGVAKAWKRINAGMERLTEKNGYADSAGEFVQRVFDAARCDKALRYDVPLVVPDHRRYSSGNYSDSSYIELSRGELRSYVNHATAKMREMYAETKAKTQA